MSKKISNIACLVLLIFAVMTLTTYSQIACVSFYGIESARGEINEKYSTVNGVTYVLISSGEWESQYLAINLDHEYIFPSAQVVRGNWSLVRFREGAYEGTLHGDVFKATVSFLEDNAQLVQKENIKNTTGSLRATGGTGIFANLKTGYVGDLELNTNTYSGETNGTLNLNL